MSNVIAFDLTHGVHYCEECFAERTCKAHREASDPQEKARLALKVEDALGMGPTPCQLVGFIGRGPWD